MMNADYKIEAFTVLLNKDCILTGMYPLIPYKDMLVSNFKKIGCVTKSDCERVSDEGLLQAGLPDMGLVNIFRRFLVMYDINPNKLKEIDKISVTSEQIAVYRELYQLPGVKYTRANLYYKAGFWSLEDIARSSFEEILEKTEKVITEENLNLKVPLVKEVKTHIAVAKAFTGLYKR